MHYQDFYQTSDYDIKQQKWYCPNCAALLIGYSDSDGKVRIKCPKCKAWTVKYRENRSVDIIEIRMTERSF